MGQYRKKPVVIEARQYDGTVNEAMSIINWILSNSKDEQYEYVCEDPTACGDGRGSRHALVIYTLEGNMVVSANDYVIKGVQGEFYPCKPDIFEQTYEKVEDNAE